MSVSIGARPARAKATPVSRERFPMYAGYGGAWPDNEPTRRATHQRPGAAGVEGTGGTGGHGRASRSTTPSRRLACGDLAGGRARRRPEHQRSRKHQAQSQITAVGCGRARQRRGLAAVPVGGGGAWPDNEPTRRATHQRPGAAGVEGAGGSGGCKRAWLRCPWAVAGPGRTTSRRAERSSQRGRLAGGPPPTGAQSSPARRVRPDGARNTSGATSTTERRSLRTPRSTPGSGRPGGRRGGRAR